VVVVFGFGFGLWWSWLGLGWVGDNKWWGGSRSEVSDCQARGYLALWDFAYSAWLGSDGGPALSRLAVMREELYVGPWRQLLMAHGR
jgi:hypothetical protein